MSILAHVVMGGSQQSEPAATQALAYILKSNAAIARALVELLRDVSVDFEPGRIEAELTHEESQPDLTVFDTDGHKRVFVENKFWAGLTGAQPVSYLNHLPEIPLSALVFIVPEKRMPAVWLELRKRCSDTQLDWKDERSGCSVMGARVDGKAMLATSWKYVLNKLLDAARLGGLDSIRDDILQLQGLTEQMDIDAFLPLREDEVTDQSEARRQINYVDLIEPITDKLKESGIASTKGLGVGNGPHYTGRYFYVDGKFYSWLGIDFRQWRDAGVTPLWWWFDTSAIVVADFLKKISELFTDLGPIHKDSYIPIRLKTGVEREAVIDDATAQMTRIAEKLRENVGSS